MKPADHHRLRTDRGSRGWVGAAAVVAVTLVAVLISPGASAYERRSRGDLRFIVGWGEPPPFAGERNSVQVVLADDRGPVVAGVRLEAEVGHEGASISLPMTPHFEVDAWGQPGDYRAFFVPTAPGTYDFRITGTVRGAPFDESFTSGAAIEDVVDPRSLSFPAVSTPEPTAQPPRPDLAELRRAVRRMEAVAAHTLSVADDARSLATLAMVYGALALLGGLSVALLAFFRRRPISRGTRPWGR